MEERFVTITGLGYYLGAEVFKAGITVMLVKEPDNIHDTEAIRAELPVIGKAGYVANSPRACAKGTMSAGRVYDTIADTCFGRVMFVTSNTVIVKLEPDKTLLTVDELKLFFSSPSVPGAGTDTEMVTKYDEGIKESL